MLYERKHIKLVSKIKSRIKENEKYKIKKIYSKNKP